MSDACAVIIDCLIEQRHSRGMTQAELSKAAGIAQPALARFESKRAMPQLDTLLKIASALGCSLKVVPASQAGPRTCSFV